MDRSKRDGRQMVFVRGGQRARQLSVSQKAPELDTHAKTNFRQIGHSFNNSTAHAPSAGRAGDCRPATAPRTSGPMQTPAHSGAYGPGRQGSRRVPAPHQ